MKVFQTNRMGFYVGVTEADESPLEPGVVLMPAGAVAMAPPEAWPAGLWPRWNGSSWTLVNEPRLQTPVDPAEKLRSFIDGNPDVAEWLLRKDGGADV